VTMPLDLNADVQARALQRLKRIEGQARGIQRMIEEGRDCREIMQQLAALRSATHAVSLQLFQEFALHCLQTADDPAVRESLVSDLVQTAARLAQ
jgi:DNA-binding FrmR family transcriptional regulator